MLTDIEKRRYKRYQNAARTLNEQAYAVQSARNKVKRFTPCEKSVVLIRADLSLPASVVEQEVLLTHCPCHPDLTPDGLLDMEFTEERNVK